MNTPTDKAGHEHRLVVVDAQDHAADFDRLDRYQALEPGYYWTAQASDRAYKEGETLLLMDVIEFEERPHSVTLRVHPSRGESTFTMLVNDFLDAFIPNPDGEAVREREQQEVMADVTMRQADLVRIQSDPQLLMEAVREKVEKGLAAMEKEEARTTDANTEKLRKRQVNLDKLHRRAARRSEAKGNPLVAPKITLSEDVGGFIGNGINEQGITELKTMAERHALVARAQGEWLQEQTRNISRVVGCLTPYFTERSAVAVARASSAMKLAKRIGRGVASLDLYVGTGVDVFDLKTGAAAPISEPLTLIQGKRYAEEELAAWADVDASFDFSDKGRFFDALISDAGLLDQVLPFPRCVVSIAMTRHQRNYGDALANLMNNLENQLVFLLVRNGENVHVVYSSSPSHEGAKRLFPTTDDLEAPFRGFDGERISIRDVEFGEKAEQFENLNLVYRRFLILLCGLDHRLNLFGQFYPAEMQMSFMSAQFQANYFRFIHDEEASNLIGESLEPLSSWFAKKNLMLQSGSRVFVLNSYGLQSATPELKRRSALRTVSSQFDEPFIAFKDSGDMAVTIRVVDRYTPRGDENAKAYLHSTENDAHQSTWWLCIDGVSAGELNRYRHSRVHRSMGVSFLRLFRRLEALLEREAIFERAAREYLLQAAVEYGDLPADIAQAALNTAVRNWRAAHRGAALPGIDDKAALNEVLSLMAPEGHLPAAMEKMLAAYLTSSGATPLLLSRSGKNKLFLYAEPTADDMAPYPNVLDWRWVKRITLEPGKTKLKEGASSLVWLKTVQPASESEVRRWPGLEAWLNERDEPISLRKYASLIPLLEAAKEWEPVLRAGVGSGIPDSLFHRVLNSAVRLNSRRERKYILDPVLAIPVAAYSAGGHKLTITYLTEYAGTVLYTYGDQAQRKRVAAVLSRSNAQRGRLHTKPRWTLCTTTSHSFIAHDDADQDEIPDSTKTMKWAEHEVKKNLNRNERSWQFTGMQPPKKGEGKPSLTHATARVSLNRALLQLSGVAPAYLKRAFRKDMRRKAREHGMFISISSDEAREVFEARRKRERAEILSTPYSHVYRAVFSPLVWASGAKTPQANAVFTAPILQPASRST